MHSNINADLIFLILPEAKNTNCTGNVKEAQEEQQVGNCLLNVSNVLNVS